MFPTKCARCGVTLTIQESAGRRCPACGAALTETAGGVPAREPPLYVEPSPRPMREPAPRRGGVFTFILALLALLVAAAAFAQSWWNDPFGIGLVGYDFSTPEAALKSDSKMTAKGDLRAVLAYHSRRKDSHERTRYDSLKIEETLDAKKGKLVLFSYKHKDKVRYEVDGFVFDEAAKLWYRDFELEFSQDLDETVRKKISDWRAKERGGP